MSMDFSVGHAHLVFGTREAIQETIDLFLQKTGSELFLYSYKNLSVGDVRSIQGRAVQTTASGQLIVIEADALVLAAQNALLKMIEEPQEGTTYLIIVPPSSYVIDTVRSRVQTHESSGDTMFDPEQFLKMNYKEREGFFKEFIGEDDTYERARVARFFRELLQHAMTLENIDRDMIKRLEELSRYALDISSSIKHISLAFAAELPVIQSRTS